MSHRAGQPYHVEFCTADPTTGAAANASSTPVVTANRNGTDDVAFTISVANVDTGRYVGSGTHPTTYAAGDDIAMSVAATVGGVAGKAVIDKFVVDGPPFPTIQLSGKVKAATTPDATHCTVTLDAALDAGTTNADFTQPLTPVYMTYTSGPRLPLAGKIATATIASLTEVAFTFATGTFSAGGAAGNTVMITS